MDSNNHSNNSASMAPAFHLDWSPFAVPVYGFLMPLIAVVTFVTNALVLAVLLRRQMRSPTNALLTALAVSDTVTSVCPVPCFVHFYTVGQRYLDWVPYSWCFAYFCLTDYLPTVFHTASIWLTASLAVQRYVLVCCPAGSTIRRRLCTMRSTICVIVGVYIAAIASQACRLGELTFSAVRLPSRQSISDATQNNGTTIVQVTACLYEHTPFVARYETVYYNIYYWSRVLLIHVIPCSALVVLNAGLIRTMRAAHQRRRQLTSQPRTTLSVSVTRMRASQYEMQLLASLSDASALPAPAAAATDPSSQHGCAAGRPSGGDPSRATMMLVVVLGVFLVVEVPLSVLLLLVIIENTFNVDLFSDVTRHMAALLVNCCIVITYPLNLFIYCAMSERFRRRFRDLFRCRANTRPLFPASAHRSARIELE